MAETPTRPAASASTITPEKKPARNPSPNQSEGGAGKHDGAPATGGRWDPARYSKKDEPKWTMQEDLLILDLVRQHGRRADAPPPPPPPPLAPQMGFATAIE